MKSLRTSTIALLVTAGLAAGFLPSSTAGEIKAEWDPLSVTNILPTLVPGVPDACAPFRIYAMADVCVEGVPGNIYADDNSVRCDNTGYQMGDCHLDLSQTDYKTATIWYCNAAYCKYPGGKRALTEGGVDLKLVDHENWGDTPYWSWHCNFVWGEPNCEEPKKGTATTYDRLWGDGPTYSSRFSGTVMYWGVEVNTEAHEAFV